MNIALCAPTCIPHLTGDSLVLQSGHLGITIWRDNKDVSVMSTNVQPGEQGVVRRMQHDATSVDVPAPTSVISYNKWMGGVDRGDQLRQYYHLRLKSRKFYKYIFWFLIDVCIVNTYILHKYYSNSPNAHTTLKPFRLELAKSLIGHYNSRKRAVPRTNHLLPPPPTRVALQHFPTKRKTASKKGVSRCWYCAHVRRPTTRKETFWYCEHCDLHLCHTGESATDCFLRYHTNLLR